MTAFLGMRGTGDWATYQMPENWRETILYLYPNGDAPLTAIMSMMGAEETDSPIINWWTKTLPSQGGSITGVYTDSAMTSAYTSGGVSGSTLYIKVALATAQQIRPGHQVLLRYTSDLNVDVNAKVTAVTKNGDSSKITVSLLEADDNSASYDLSDANYILVVGNINAQGAPRPDAISYDPTLFSNYTQIFRTPLSITRTARKTKLRTGDAYKEAKRECLELHSVEMEKNLIYSIPTAGTGENGKPEYTLGGLLHFIKTYASDNVNSYNSNASYSGKTWLEAGGDWLDTYLEQIFRDGKEEKLAFCGSGALLGLKKLAETYGNIQLNPTTTAYGLKIVEWVTPNGILYLKRHPLFSYDATMRNSMLIYEPEKVKYRPLDDTFFKPSDEERKSTSDGIDGTEEEFLTEASIEVHHPSAFGFLNGVGEDNAV